MNTKSSLIVALCLLVSLVCSGAFAQNRYTCPSGNGSTTYVSATPCSRITYYGPAGSQPAPTYYPKAGDAPDHLQYLSPRCSSMSEGLRTSAARGVKYDVIAALQKEYARECADDDREARQRLATRMNDTAQDKRKLVEMAALNREQTKIQQEQCQESKRIITMKKARTDLSELDQQNLQRFIENYKQKCVSGS